MQIANLKHLHLSHPLNPGLSITLDSIHYDYRMIRNWVNEDALIYVKLDYCTRVEITRSCDFKLRPFYLSYRPIKHQKLYTV